jgi:hypothetical protein
MTEADWLGCSDPEAMLRFLRTQMTFRTRAARRKLRLHACACCRRIWDLLGDERSRRAIEVSEAYEEFTASAAQLKEAEEAALVAVHAVGRREDLEVQRIAATAAYLASGAQISQMWGAGMALRYALMARVGAAGKLGGLAAQQTQEQECRQHAVILRCIFGDLFRHARFDPTWRTSDAVALARMVYEERLMPSGELDRGRLAILDDALEDAGCADAEVLSHCRDTGPHVRGCWVVDLVLDRV